MAKYNKGDQIQNESSNLKGVIVDVLPPTRGRQTYIVMYSDGVTKSELEKNLTPAINLDDPFERCKNKIYGSQSDFSLANTTFKISDSSNNTLSSLKASKTLFRAYQFKPLLKFLNSDNRKILVADEVGLGKTIEAGHILLEMKARGQLQNALIICPKSLQLKWKDELKNKFGLSFKIYDRIEDLVEDLRERGTNLKGIINYEKISTFGFASVRDPRLQLPQKRGTPPAVHHHIAEGGHNPQFFHHQQRRRYPAHREWRRAPQIHHQDRPDELLVRHNNPV